MNFKQPTWLVLRWCGSCCASFLCWTFWLALSVLLVVLGWIAVRRQLPVPDFLLRRGEQRLAQSGVIARVDQVVVDPGGRVVLAGLRLYAAGQDDPLVESQAARGPLDPGVLFLGQIPVPDWHKRELDRRAANPSPKHITSEELHARLNRSE